jgi:NADH-quinone oxidoreductase subunit J
MQISFLVLGLLTIGSAVAAMSLRNLIRCALALTLTFGGLAGFYLQLGAQFPGFAQVLVYVGAVAILILFAILLTRGSEPKPEPIFSRSWAVGCAVALAVFSVLAGTLVFSDAAATPAGPAPTATVRRLGEELMSRYVLPLEVMGLLLTAALIGAVVIALQEKPRGPTESK